MPKYQVLISGQGVVVPRVRSGLSHKECASVAPPIYPYYNSGAEACDHGADSNHAMRALRYSGPRYSDRVAEEFIRFTDGGTVGVRKLSRTALRGFLGLNCLRSFRSVCRLRRRQRSVITLSKCNRGSFSHL